MSAPAHDESSPDIWPNPAVVDRVVLGLVLCASLATLVIIAVLASAPPA